MIYTWRQKKQYTRKEFKVFDQSFFISLCSFKVYWLYDEEVKLLFFFSESCILSQSYNIIYIETNLWHGLIKVGHRVPLKTWFSISMKSRNPYNKNSAWKSYLYFFFNKICLFDSRITYWEQWFNERNTGKCLVQ